MSKNFFRCVWTLAFVFTATFSTLHAQNNAPTVQEQLTAQYPYAQATDGCHVGNPDTGLVTQKAGGGLRILPFSSSGTTIAKCVNHYQDGKLKAPSNICNGEGVAKASRWGSYIPKIGGAVGAGGSKVGDQAANQQMDVVNTGDTIYPIKLEVNKDKGEVKMTFITCKQSGDSQNPYKGELAFNFPTSTLTPENVTKIEDTISEVFKQGGGDQQGNNDNQGQQGNNGGGGQQGGGGGQAQQGGQDQQQDDQASACNPEIGQTVKQVETACGKPASQAKGANTKLIYNYSQPKLKIIFINGKVSDIE